MEIAQLLLSLLHAWSLDPDLDQVCRNRLGLSKPRSSVCFGLLSRSGSLLVHADYNSDYFDQKYILTPLLPRSYDVDASYVACGGATGSFHVSWSLGSV